MNKHPQVIAGVDTHKDTHYAAIISTTGEHLGAAQFPATTAGYQALAGFITCRGTLACVGVEGTASYGAGLTRYLHSEHVSVVEVIRPKRQVRRMHGKSDEIDAYAAAHTALAGVDTVTAKTGTGMVEQVRLVLVARRSAIKAHTEVAVQIQSLLITAPEVIRDEYRGLSRPRLVARLAAARRRADDDPIAARTRAVFQSLARRYQQLDVEIARHDADLAGLVTDVNPGMMQTKGISTVTAAQLLITVGDNPERIKSEASFAMLCGAAPIPASSGKTTRHRINHGGDRAANSALHHIAIARLATDPDTRAYRDKRISEGKSKKDVLRCLKRAIAREAFHLITKPQPAETSDDLRPARKNLGLTLAFVAAAFNCSLNKISRVEHGLIRDREFVREYRDWLTKRQTLKIAA